MKGNKKKNKRKSFSHYYRKWGSRRLASHPLSELLLIGSYKKRIADLSRNNSILTSALQESLVESAHLNNLLKSYAKDCNQILFARIKLNEMVRNFAKFATDLDEVRSCLAIDLPDEYNFFQKKKLSNEKVVKVPDVSCIDEAPEISEDEVKACEETEMVHSNVIENVAPVIHDVPMSPILCDDIDGPQDMLKKSSNAVYKGSLTPQLNIDLVSTRRKRSTRSKGKASSFGKKQSSGRLVAQINTVSSPLQPEVQDPIEIDTVASKDSLPVTDTEGQLNDVEMPQQNDSNNFISIDCIKDCSVILFSDLNVKDKKSMSNVDLNQSSEIKEEISPSQTLNDNCNSPFVDNLENKCEIHENVIEINENCYKLFADENTFSVERYSRKLSDVSKKASSLHSGVQEYDEEIQNVGSLTFCESDDDVEKKNTGSSKVRTSRTRKPMNYAGYFLSSDESDTDSPFRLAVTKRKSSKKVKLKSSSIDNPSEKTITENSVELSLDVVSETIEPDYSVYNLDVPNSKREGKKSRKKPTSVKSKSKKESDVPKPLFPKCNVIKLKGGEHKFSKCETPLERKSIGKHTKKSLQNSCASPGGILKKVQSNISITFEDNIKESLPKEIGNIENVQNSKQYSMLQTPKRVSFAPTDLVCNFEKMSVSKTIADNKKVRRTSKSAADLAELFDEDITKPSHANAELSEEDQLKLSYTYAELFDEDPLNTSHIEAELFDEDQLKTSHTEENCSRISTGIPSRREDVQALNTSILFDFAGDTEMYTLAFPSNALSLPTHNDTSSKPSSPLVCEQINLPSNSNEMLIKKSPGTLPKSPKSIKKLSLKENKVIRNEVSQCSLDNADIKAAILLMESPVSHLIKPKRKSLFKELPDDTLKENINFDQLVSEVKALSENENLTKESSPALTVGIKKSRGSKYKVTVRSKGSTKKTKKNNLVKKSLELSPVLIDATNVIATSDDNNSRRRRSKQVSYKEPSLMKKLRRQ